MSEAGRSGQANRAATRACAGLAAAALALAATGATATSFMRARPHDPANACKAIEAAVAEMTGRKPQSDIWPLFYSDEFGHVQPAERPAFIRSMTSAEGKPDAAPIRITNVWPLGKREAKDHKALYVVGLQRNRWVPEHENVFDPMQTEPAGYQVVFEYWLAAFSSDNILEFREQRHVFELIDYDKRLKGCGND